MQNTVYECKQNGEDFFSSLTVTCFCFGNRPANGLVTEQPQYSVVVCIFHILQNTEIQLISNDLRLIFTCSLLLASPCIFHLGDNTLASKWRGVVTQVIRLLHLGETINSTKCFKANILYFYYTIPCCLFVMLLIINVLLSVCIDCFSCLYKIY